MDGFLKAWNYSSHLPLIPSSTFVATQAECRVSLCFCAALDQNNKTIAQTFFIYVHLTPFSPALFSVSRFTVHGTVVNDGLIYRFIFFQFVAGRWVCLMDKVRNMKCNGAGDQLCDISAYSLFQKASSCIGTSVCSSLCCTRRGVGEGSGMRSPESRVCGHGYGGRGYSRYSFLPWLASFPLRKASCTSPCSSNPLASWVR